MTETPQVSDAKIKTSGHPNGTGKGDLDIARCAELRGILVHGPVFQKRNAAKIVEAHIAEYVAETLLQPM